VKIGQYLGKIWTTVGCLVFLELDHGVVNAVFAISTCSNVCFRAKFYKLSYMTTVPQRHRQANRRTDNISVAIPRSALRTSRGKKAPALENFSPSPRLSPPLI